MENNKPENKFQIGAVSACIWKRSHTTKDGQSFEKRQVSLDRTYKDRNGNWKNSSSYDTNDIPKAILALSQAYQHLVKKSETASNGVAVEEIE